MPPALRRTGRRWGLARRGLPPLLAALALLLGARAPAPVAAVIPPAPDSDLLLVQPREGLGLDALEEALRAAGYDVRPAPRLAGAARVAVPPGADPLAVAARLAASGLARGVEPDGEVSAATQSPERLPDDPRYVQQAPYLEAVRAPAAWAVETGSEDVVIAIVDSGVDFSHQDLVGRIAYNLADARIDGRDEDGSGCPDDVAGCSFVTVETADPSCDYPLRPPHGRAADDEGHGTFVAGIAAAHGDNGEGIAGVAWQARILPVKVLDCTATGRVADAAAGIRYAARQGADVINVSFGTSRDSAVLREAVDEALAAGAVVVGSAGNEGVSLVTFPAAYPGVIAVGASGRLTPPGVDYTLAAEFTNFGPEVDLLAPGRLLVSTVPAEVCGQRGWFCDGAPYSAASGSSFASPVVAGAAALLRARHPGLSPAFVRALLVGSAAEAAGEAGLIDLAAALERPLFELGAPGLGREGGGAPPGPAERAPGQATAPVQPVPPAQPAAPAAPTPRAPLPAPTGHGPPRPRRAHPSAPSRRRARARSS